MYLDDLDGGCLEMCLAAIIIINSNTVQVGERHL